MPQAVFRFYAELNDFLPRERRQASFSHAVTGRASVKDVIESLGVPHTEVDLILVNGLSVDFGHIVADGDRVSVYPVFEAMDISPVIRLRPQPLRETAFVLDTHLGKLAAHLRLLGFDTLYHNDRADEALLRLSVDERRILLTRDRGLLKRRELTHGYYVRATDPDVQIREVLGHFDLWASARPFTRCLACNGQLEAVPREAVADHVPPDVLAEQSEYRRCSGCGRVFWRGSHYDALSRFVEAVLAARPAR